MREYSSSTRGSMTSASVWRESIRGGRSPTPATSTIWPASASCLSAQPWRTLSSSASAVGVRSAIAMSLVIWSPAIGTTAVWRIAPSRNTAMSLVPPPMSTRHTPSSFSSSVSTASEDASGCRIRSFTSSPQRRTHLTMFCAAETAPVTMCTLTSSRTPLMPSGSRTPSCPSMMNSCVRMWSTCWSVGIGMARAVSIARSTSIVVTSLSLIATIPVELKLLIWLPAIPVKTRSILQSAINSASSSVRWIAFTVASMFTTTPFFRPLDSWPPMPMMSMRPSGKSSATIATTLEVPMSSATMRFLFSLAISDPLGHRFLGLGFPGFRNPQRKAVGVAQVDVIEAALGLAERLRVHRNEFRETLLDAVLVRVAPELHGEAAGKPELPGKARIERDLPGLEGERGEQLAENGVAARHFAFASRGPGEDRERRVDASGKKLAVCVHHPLTSLAPARERHVLLDPYLQAIGPAAPHFGAAHPGNAFEQRAYRLQIDGKNRSRHTPLKRGDDLAALDMPELASDYNCPERKRRGPEQDPRPRVGDERERHRVKQVRGEVGKAGATPHDCLPPPQPAPTREYGDTGLRTTVRHDAPPWAQANGLSFPER